VKRIALTLAVILTAACQAPIIPTAVPAPQKLDCDLIFPAPSLDTLTP
jgi:energy-converting hydrogenase Eha subunit A